MRRFPAAPSTSSGSAGPGMSGLALVAKRWAPTVTGSDQAESSYCARLARPGIEPRHRPRRRQPARGRRGGRLHGDPGGQPRARGGARGRRDGAAPRRPARRAVAHEAHDRGGRGAWQDDHRVDGGARAARVGPRAGVPDRRRAALGWHQCRVGRGRLGRDRGRRVRPLVPGARARRGRDHEHRAGPPRHLRDLGELEAAFAEFAEPAAVRVLGPGVELPATGTP